MAPRACWLLLPALAACAAPDAPWYRSLEPDSPCYRVDLTDGLDEDTTAEVQDLFACANHHGHLASLEPTAAALETPSPAAVPAGIELARAVNAAPDAGVEVDLTGALGVVIGVVEDEALSSQVQDIALEAVYGENQLFVRREGYDLAAVDGGAIAPLGPVIPELALVLEQDGGESLDLLADVLEDPETGRWVRTIDGWIRSEHPDVAGPVQSLLPHLGEAMVSARSPDNDRWSGASGHSLRDLVDALARDDLLDTISPELASMLGDPVVRRELPDLLVELQRDGHLQRTPAQATFLTQLDARGGRLDPGEDSALVSLLRLLDGTNRPMQCRVDLWVTVVDVDLGNLAVTLLRVLADQDPDDVQSAAAILGNALGGYGIGEGVVRSIAESGACPAFTPQVAEDLYAIERLGEPGTRGLTHTLLGLARVLRDGEQDRLQDLVDIISDLHRADAVRPVEEALRDGGDGELGADLVNLVAVMDRPGSFGITAGDEPATTLEDLFEILVWVVEPGSEGRTGWDRLRPLLTPALEHDGTWSALDRLGPLLADRQSASSRGLDVVTAVVRADPELSALSGLAPTLRTRTITDPTLRLMRTRPVMDSLLATRPAAEQAEVPLAFAGRLIVRGSLDDLLRMVRALLHDIDGMDTPPGP